MLNEVGVPCWFYCSWRPQAIIMNGTGQGRHCWFPLFVSNLLEERTTISRTQNAVCVLDTLTAAIVPREQLREAVQSDIVDAKVRRLWILLQVTSSALQLNDSCHQLNHTPFPIA